VSDEQRTFRIETQCDCAIWPGAGAICVRVSAPKFFEPMFYLGNVKTGAVSMLVPYIYREHGPRGAHPL
jgi:hypothetical protein